MLTRRLTNDNVCIRWIISSLKSQILTTNSIDLMSRQKSQNKIKQMGYVNSSIGTISVLRSVVSPNQCLNMTTEPANWRRLWCSQHTRSLALDFAKKGKYNIDVHLHSNCLFGKGVVCADIAWSTLHTRS